MEINKDKLTQIPEYKEYFLTEYGKICYFNKKLDKWMFCKKSLDNKGFVEAWVNYEKILLNQAVIADRVIGKSWRMLCIDYNNKTKVPRKEDSHTDGRYKPGVDTGRFGAAHYGKKALKKQFLQRLSSDNT